MNILSKLRWSDWLGLGMIVVSIVLSSVVGDQFSLFLIIGLAALASRWIFRWTDRIGWGRHGEGWVNRMCFWMFLFGMGLYTFAQVWYKGDNILVDFFATWVFYLLASVCSLHFRVVEGPLWLDPGLAPGQPCGRGGIHLHAIVVRCAERDPGYCLLRGDIHLIRVGRPGSAQ